MGNFGSNFDKYSANRIIDQRMIALYELQGWRFCNALSKDTCLVERDLLESEKRWKNVAVAASITGFVRAYLWRAMKEAKGLVYVDTDNLKTLEPCALPVSDKLGDWKFEGKYRSGAIGMEKFYCLEYWNPKIDEDGKAVKYHTATKGVKVNPNDIIKLVKGEIGEIVYKQESPTFSVKTGKSYLHRTIILTKKAVLA